MKRYNPKEIEPKWQKTWADSKIYAAKDFDTERQKYVMLTEFPYPSGDGLHLGHVREYTLGDIMARHKRMEGYNVLYPMGYDAFGLPTENYAIKNKIAPQVATDQNVGNFQKQFESLGYSIDWDRSFRTTDPEYYKWTQWLFLQFYKAGLAYQEDTAINWCPKCKTGLANEEVVAGRHERCDTIVEKKQLKQWLLGITQYADRLIEGLQTVDYPSRIADQQVNWIGRSVGAEVDFKVEDSDQSITVFTTRPDTLFGATFMVLAPEHPLVGKITTEEQSDEVNKYIVKSQAKTEIERQDTSREKTGVFTGAYAINPVNNQKIPVWIADYVLYGYGTGAIMAVPAHDERDNEFAKKFDLPIITVIEPLYINEKGDSAVRPDQPVVGRNAITAIVKHWSEDKYIGLKWKKVDWDTFITGGVESGQTPEQAAIAEIQEETGYQNLKMVKQLDNFHSKFFHGPKNENRFAHFSSFYFELIDDTKKEIAEDEIQNHDVIWLTKKDMEEFDLPPGHRHVWNQLHGLESVNTSEGVMINSGKYNDMSSSDMREKIVADLENKGFGKEKVNYKLRDWIFSRQHYWGEPIPIIHCEKDGAVAVPEADLPVVLPDVDHYEPTDSGESPLAAITDWVNVQCPVCGGPAKRETDTMPNWAGSSWYYLRYFDAHNDKEFANRKKLDYWGQVDMYLGGMEHTTLHLLYSRFWHQFFYDQGLVPTPEPYAARRGQGIVLATDGTKMSKSKGNVVNPNEMLEAGYGADAVRLSIAFLAPFDQTTPWSPEGVAGTFRFIQRFWTLVQDFVSSDEVDNSKQDSVLVAAHKAIYKVSKDLNNMAFNTAVSALMECVNDLYKVKADSGFSDRDSWKFALGAVTRLLAPFAPHVSEEIWQDLGNEGSVHIATWPVHDQKYLVSDTTTIVVQVNGKVRAKLEMPTGSDEESVVAVAKKDGKVTGFLADNSVKKTIYIQDKLLNIVV